MKAYNASMKAYPDEVKAQVIAERNSGSSWDSLSARYGVPVTTIRGWVLSGNGTVPTLKTSGLSAYDLDAMALRLIDGSVSALGAIQSLATEKDWLRGQDAGQLAILYGVVADKLIRVLGSIKPEPPDDGSAALTGADSAGAILAG